MLSDLISEFVYHYTSVEGMRGILRDRRIMVSTNTARDAFYGVGVYLTDVPPEVDDKDLLRKLYGRAYPSKMNKIQVCFRFRARQLRGLQEEEEEKRKVFVVPREAIDIDAVETMMKGRSGDSWNPGWMNASTRK